MIIAITSKAVKVYTLPVVVTQSDGTLLTVIAHGDEDMHYYTTTDGVLLSHVGFDYYIADVDQNGNLIASSQLAHEKVNRNVVEQLMTQTQKRNTFYTNMERVASENRIKREPLDVDNTFFPHIGEPKAVVLLVDFSDTVFSVSNPKRTFEQYLNGEGAPVNYGNNENKNYSSVRQYFTDMSNGQFTPKFDVFGVFHLPHPLKYYGANEDMQKLIEDACTAAKDSMNFSNYDANNDGQVDLVYIIYAGYSESISQNSSECIWPKSGTLYGGSYNGKIVRRYGVNNELNGYPGAYSKAPYKRVNGVGLFCHEFSHCLGLPDFYPTVNSARIDNQAMEFWDIMDGGEYLYNGYYPTAYTAWERESMGWLSIDTVSKDQTLKLSPIDIGGKAYKFLNDKDKTGKEYFVFEDIQNIQWNKKQEGHGLLIYHVNYNKSTFSLSSNSVNNMAGRPGMTIIPADGRLLSSYSVGVDTIINPSTGKPYTAQDYYAQLAGDAFPGTKGTTDLNDTTTTANFLIFNNSTSDLSTIVNKAISCIHEDEDGNITINYINDFATGIKNLYYNQLNNDDKKIYSVSGVYMGTDRDKLNKGIYIIGNKKIIIK